MLHEVFKDVELLGTFSGEGCLRAGVGGFELLVKGKLVKTFQLVGSIIFACLGVGVVELLVEVGTFLGDAFDVSELKKIGVFGSEGFILMVEETF